MTIPTILTIMLLGHILGDFYVQSKTMADNKDVMKKWLLIHSGVYSLCMATILFVGVGFSRYWVFIVVGASIAHLVIDWLKKYIPCKKFIIDQLLHLAVIIALWCIWGRCLSLRAPITTALEYSLPAELMIIALGLLILLKPVGLLIEKGDIWDFNKGNSAALPTSSQKGAGKMIGYLERIIIFFLLVNRQFGAIAFVLAAKSVMRFPEINDSDKPTSLAEFYIIGTLLSMTSVFIVAFALGLI
ncbi:MAG: DUF3307 domain-containing protein [Defluviitaleaceae bacterium]|nr:DUF3307 domain-containing protein [Defluviitaleaceae bacterium]